MNKANSHCFVDASTLFEETDVRQLITRCCNDCGETGKGEEAGDKGVASGSGLLPGSGNSSINSWQGAGRAVGSPVQVLAPEVGQGCAGSCLTS